MKSQTTTKNIYKAIIRLKCTPLHEQITRGHIYNIIDFATSFTNIHLTQLTPTQKQTTYRLLYKNTPTGQNNRLPCPICNKNITETEDHIFYDCTQIRQTRDALTKMLNTGLEPQTDIHRAIFLNTLPKQPQETHLIKLIILAIYRQTIWTVRLDTKFNMIKHNELTILNKFIYTTTHTLTKYNLWAAFERLLN